MVSSVNRGRVLVGVPLATNCGPASASDAASDAFRRGSEMAADESIVGELGYVGDSLQDEEGCVADDEALLAEPEDEDDEDEEAMAGVYGCADVRVEVVEEVVEVVEVVEVAGGLAGRVELVDCTVGISNASKSSNSSSSWSRSSDPEEAPMVALGAVEVVVVVSSGGAG